MTKAEKNRQLRTNTIYWLAAMALPALFHFGFKAFASESAKFPWPVVIPFLYVGFAIASNKMLSQAIGKATDE